jgi:hypothetical protein
MDDLKAFRQWGSRTPGHPENFETPGVEVTTGLPLVLIFKVCFIPFWCSSGKITYL